MNHHFSGREPSPAFRAACGNHEDNALAAERAGARTLVLTHLSAEIDRAETRDEILRAIGRVFSGRVIWGEDLMEIDVQSS
jgi:ribonuclease BN (tRNA processing enzyme)